MDQQHSLLTASQVEVPSFRVACFGFFASTVTIVGLMPTFGAVS
jgi:hypothetical protein